MLRYLRFYGGPALSFTVAFAMFFGGVCLWLPAMGYTTLIATLDQVLPRDTDERPYEHEFFLDLPLYLSTPAALVLFFSTFWALGHGSQDPFGAGAAMQRLTGVDVIAARSATPWYDHVLMFVALILPMTAAGGLAGHELTHRTWRPFDLWLGRITMACNWGICFPIEHVYGHHAYVGTTKDPATAARGDSVYQHLPKALYRTVVNAYEIESTRLRKLDASFLSPKNVLLRMGLVSLAFTGFAYWCSGWAGVTFYLGLCFGTKLALEVLNYIEHYGLLRVPSEPVQPRHSWNDNHVVSGIFTYNLTRHSHHHADAQVPYQDLRAHAEQPEMPGGFMTAYLSALVPQLWRKKIAPKLLDWDRNQADPREYPLIREANRRSNWVELTQSAANTAPDLSAVAGGNLGY